MNAQLNNLLQVRTHLENVNIFRANKDDEYGIDEGFFALEEISASNTPEGEIAENLAETYMASFHQAIRSKLSDQCVPEPDLEALLRSVRALEASLFSDKFDFKSLRMELALKLIDSYYEGYSKKEKFLEIKNLISRIDNERRHGS